VPEKRRRRIDPESPVPLWVPKSQLLRGAGPVRVKPDFSTSYLDFDRGIRMGNLQPNQRITQILKHALQARHDTRFITDRWGRGVYWKWICWLPVENRQAKPKSNKYNFGCAKYYITISQSATFEAGLQIERAPTRPGAASHVHTQSDWDFHHLVRGLRRGTPLAGQIARLVRKEGFAVRAGAFAARDAFTSRSYRGPAALARACKAIPRDAWGGFQLCYLLSKPEIKAMSGHDVVATVLAIFDELVPAINAVMTVPCLKGREEDPAWDAGNKR